MAGIALNSTGSFKSPGKMRAFLNGLVAAVARFLRLKKKTKAAPRSAKRSVKGKQKSAAETKTNAPEAATDWSPERLNVIKKLWGEGCTSPGSAGFLRVTLPLLSLSEKKSLLLLGAGLGGLGRAMVEETGVWVTGFEADEELVALAKDMTRMAGMQKRAPVSKIDLEGVKLKENSFNTVVSLESMYRVSAKQQLYTAMAAALRGDGELLMTDFVKAGDGPPGEKLSAWLAGEPTTPHLWTAEEIQSFLKTLNLDVRPFEDVTAQFRGGIFKGFFNYLANVTKPELLEISGDLIAECEYWAGQLAAIDSGELKVYQFHAFKLPDKHKKTI
jgi:2-polyprenyl-3-methyl-5-hydroxy-6-metoxy-1,4-benzoquinol methylase